MIIRQLKESKFTNFYEQLVDRAQQNPMEASFQVQMKIDKREYSVRLQPENDCKIAVLQAWEIEKDAYGHLHSLITDNKILSSLFEIILSQGIRR